MVHFFITTALFLVSFLKYIYCAVVPLNHSNQLNHLETLPSVLIDEVFEFVNDVEIAGMRTTCRAYKARVEEYLKKRRLKAMILKNPSVQKLSMTRLWQLSCLMGSSDFTIKAVMNKLYNPHLCKDHMKLLRFLSIYPEFSEYFACLKGDRSGFIEPMKRMYGRRIRGVEEFLEVMGLEPDCRRRSDAIEFDDICDEDMGIFFVMMRLMKCMGW